MRRFPILLAPLALLSLALTLAACGNKGPLVRASEAAAMEEEAAELEADDAATVDDDAGEAPLAEALPEDPVEDADADPAVVPPPPADPGHG